MVVKQETEITDAGAGAGREESVMGKGQGGEREDSDDCLGNRSPFDAGSFDRLRMMVRPFGELRVDLAHHDGSTSSP